MRARRLWVVPCVGLPTHDSGPCLLQARREGAVPLLTSLLKRTGGREAPGGLLMCLPLVCGRAHLPADHHACEPPLPYGV